MKRKKILLSVLGVALLLGALAAYFGLNYYNTLFKSNVKVNGDAYYLYVPTGASLKTLQDSLRSAKAIIDEDCLLRAVELTDFEQPKPGRYKLTSGMSNRTLLRMLKTGNQSPVRLTLSGNIRTNDKLASIVSRYIEPDSTQLLSYFNNNDNLEEYGVNASTLLGICILNTYEFYWNTTPEEFVARMYKECDRFWNEERENKRKQTPWSRLEVMTIASIVAEETVKTDEMPRVAGVYINRLKKGWKLEADPTLKYAVSDFTIRRVLNKHKEVDSPYNTYKYEGLPPGPICIPSTAAIDAVLNAEQHDYMFFCAKADFSGYHAFAKTLTQHNRNAAEYQKALNKMNIYR